MVARSSRPARRVSTRSRSCSPTASTCGRPTRSTWLAVSRPCTGCVSLHARARSVASRTAATHTGTGRRSRRSRTCPTRHRRTRNPRTRTLGRCTHP
ncbi:hypothetical protein ACFPRL_31995 [Pseudoclavibacter helvolus]